MLRFLQGFAVGGEWGGAVLLVAEHSPNQSRAFWASWPQAAVPVGNMLATVVLLGADRDAVGIGVPVLGMASRVLAVCRGGADRLLHPHQGHRCADIRRGATGSRTCKAVSYGVIEVLKRYPRGVFTAMGLRFAENIMYYLVVIVSITYLKVQVGVDTNAILLWHARRPRGALRGHPPRRQAGGSIRPPTGLLRRHQCCAGTWGFFAFPMMDSSNYLVIMGAIIIGLVIHALMYAPQPAIMAEMFPTRMRYSGVSLGYQVTSIVAGSLAPAISVKLLDIYDSSVPIALYLAAASVVTLIAVLFHPRDEGHRPGERRSGRPRGTRQSGRGMTDLNGRTALVTGGASGIGAACARELAARGATVTVADVDEVGAKDLAADIGGQAWAVDLLDISSLEDLQLETDILVNNAGVQSINSIVDFPPEQFRSMLTLMVEAPFLLIRAALPHMYRQKFGRVINISSVHGIRASEYKVAYVTAKHALEGLSKVTALEGGPHDVTSNCVNPGYVRTPLVTKQIADQARKHGIPEDQVVAEILLKESAIKRLVEPEQVAALVGWLASPAAGMVTGASYTMDGGWSAR